MSRMSATLGIDLSSQPKNTAVCMIDWSATRADVVALWRGTDPDGSTLCDELLIAVMRGTHGLPRPSKVAIDAPLGWPAAFVQAVSNLAEWPVKIDESRARLERRATDHWVHRATGKQPLSVTTDRIAYPAMRASGLLAHFARVTGEPVDRSGMSGSICETYPDPAIRRFGLWPATAGARDSYKGAALHIRAQILERLDDAAAWLALSETDRHRCIASDDCLDCLICALAARAAMRGRTAAPPDDLAAEAVAEGWIHVPEPGSLSALL
jgi:Protein of unknown function (DUF429)